MKTNIIYLRLSKVDFNKGEKDTKNKLQADLLAILERYPNLKDEGYKVIEEVKSAYKGVAKGFESVIHFVCDGLTLDNYVKLSSQRLLLDHDLNIYVVSYDRLSRNNVTFTLFHSLCFIRGVKVYSLLNSENELRKAGLEILTKDSFEQALILVRLLLLGVHSAQHSEDMSKKIKRRVTTEGGKTISKKSGKRWGRPILVKDFMRKRIMDLAWQGLNPREISERSDVYITIVSNHVPNVKKSLNPETIRKIIKSKY